MIWSSLIPAKHHPEGVQQAYREIRDVLEEFGFNRVQGSLHMNESADMANVFLAIQSLRSRAWLLKSVRDIRAFRVEQWSDVTAVIKAP